eukprot:SRR837773.4803.p1 GENE.SRR837773.4803~~SRR837773.4803.p1  ORF type:complete len:295 (-),score=35.21 SRR837773.4803:226-1050(-)
MTGDVSACTSVVSAEDAGAASSMTPQPGDCTAGGSSGSSSPVRRAKLIAGFNRLIAALEELCFGGSSHSQSFSVADQTKRPCFGVQCNEKGDRFLVERSRLSVKVSGMSIPSAHSQSRDWFELFYDSMFSPPKAFVVVLQWMVCSSVHLTSFCQKFGRLCEDHGFRLVRLPIGQLFPQPAPPEVWSEDMETNFDRLAMHAPRKLRLPDVVTGEARELLHAELLATWFRPPLSLLGLFCSQKVDFKVEFIPDQTCTSSSQKVQNHQVFQRLRGGF